MRAGRLCLAVSAGPEETGKTIETGENVVRDAKKGPRCGAKRPIDQQRREEGVRKRFVTVLRLNFAPFATMIACSRSLGGVWGLALSIRTGKRQRGKQSDVIDQDGQKTQKAR